MPVELPAARDPAALIDSAFAWRRLAVSLTLGTVGSIGMWSFVVALPAVEADLGISRNMATVPYTAAMLGFGLGGVVLGRLVDRFGFARPAIGGALALSLGYVLAWASPNLMLLALAHALIGCGASTTFGPLMADLSHWFLKRRGFAVTICSSGNYLAGALWPPLIQHAIAGHGWRFTHLAIAVLCLVAMLPLIALLRRPSPVGHGTPPPASSRLRPGSPAVLGLSTGGLQGLLIVAGLACCVAMAMPQVHIVAYCGDLGYGPARGAEMLSLMLGLGVFSRVFAGWAADRIGGLATLLVGSALQGVALALYLFFDGLISLYVISGLFGLFQGGIVPMYAVIVRDYFPPREAGQRVGIVILATVVGMALGGWMSGAIFDLTGSYQAAFLNGLAWNLVNVTIALWLLMRRPRQFAPAA